ncbi:hypothetical protein BDV96DRAFT_654497 [Lophiotrema nucula]|uniref:Uncharacterized protein n=1 Tax=Lophiotrema nucula TaxID=690887 RepID=A0A6A5YJ04_9PLEO|nr:hypothetical protein BDV96DRAFT_654497 [Lophiotrema nucula]
MPVSNPWGRPSTATIPPPPSYTEYMAVGAFAIFLSVTSGNRALARFISPLTILGSVGALHYLYRTWDRAHERSRVRAIRRNVVKSQQGAAILRELLEHKMEESTALLAGSPSSAEKEDLVRQLKELKEAMKEVDRLEQEVKHLESQI